MNNKRFKIPWREDPYRVHFPGLNQRGRPRTKIQESERRSFCCPQCKTDLSINIIRLRQDLYDCRLCNKPFIKENVIESFDFDDLLHDTPVKRRKYGRKRFSR